jgi:glycosyltransferase involved in cell wall biosynthesis
LRRGNTQFTGQLTQLNSLLVCKTARVHALPSLRESPGLSSLEAGALGLNCVVGDTCPVVEYFGTDAFVCNPLDWCSVRTAVLEAYETPRSVRLRERILRTFTWAKAAEATLAGYEFAVAHNRS